MLVLISRTLLLAVSSVSVAIKQTVLRLDAHYMHPKHEVNLVVRCTQNIQDKQLGSCDSNDKGRFSHGVCVHLCVCVWRERQ